MCDKIQNQEVQYKPKRIVTSIFVFVTRSGELFYRTLSDECLGLEVKINGWVQVSVNTCIHMLQLRGWVLTLSFRCYVTENLSFGVAF